MGRNGNKQFVELLVEAGIQRQTYIPRSVAGWIMFCLIITHTHRQTNTNTARTIILCVPLGWIAERRKIVVVGVVVVAS